MTKSLLADAPNEPLGRQRPRIELVPPAAYSDTVEAVLEICEIAGLFLDPWQEWFLTASLGERVDLKWAAFQVGLIVARQNGKGSALEGRELGGMFAIDEERLLIHSAHEQATSSEHQRRLVDLIGESPRLHSKVKPRGIKRGKGEEAIELKDGTRILFKTRTGGGGRGFTGDLVVLDEAMILPETFMSSLVPTMAARSIEGNPQIWLTGSSPDQMNPKHDGVVLSRLRSNALKGSPRLLYAEWSAEGDDPAAVPESVRNDPNAWAQANPGLGIRISHEYVRDEMRTLGPRSFAVERLGIGSWPDPDAGQQDKISLDAWDALVDRASRRVGPVAFTFDVSPNSASAAIAVGGHRADDLEHVEIVDHRQGTSWLVDRIVELDERHGPESWECDARGPAAQFVEPLANRGVRVETVDAAGNAQACGSLVAAVKDGSFRHLGTPEVRDALQGAGTRPLVDAWAWARTASSGDICPLVAFTLARRKAELMRASAYESQDLLIA